LTPVHFLQASEDFRSCNGNEGGAVTEKYQRQATLKSGKDGKHQHGEASNDPGKNKREENKATKHGFAREVGAIKSQSGEKAEDERKYDGPRGNEKTVEDGIPDRGVGGEELAVPIESEMPRRKAAYAVTIERIDDENDDGQIDEREHKRCVGCEKR